MKSTNGKNRRIGALAGIVMWLFFFATTTSATTHMINFGGTLGNKYNPATLTAVVGDTIIWEGSFTVHPLSSTSIPSGAATWHDGSGTSFSYVITVAGTYNYKCDVHTGMVGSFSAGATGIVSSGNASPERLGAHLLPAITNSRYMWVSVPHRGPVTARMFSLDGSLLAATTVQAAAAGVYPLVFEAFPAYGTYCVEVRFDGKLTSGIFSRTR